MRIWSRSLSLLLLAAALAACGFTLRGTTPLPFETLYLGVNENTAFGSWLKRSIQASSPGTRLVQSPREAQAIYVEVGNTRTLREVSLNAIGRVEQYELTVAYTFRVVDRQGRAYLPDTQLFSSRGVPYDDQVQQAKDEEHQRVYEDLEQGLIARIVRRLTAPDVRETASRLVSGTPTAADEDVLNVPQLDPAPTNQPDAWRRDSPRPDGMFSR
ncbi:MAG: hypothetical protein JHC61_12505 [Burkholderiaceae bacterium]|nr:hypothetical protein [Burkholderiaceae bacterium]